MLFSKRIITGLLAAAATVATPVVAAQEDNHNHGPAPKAPAAKKPAAKPVKLPAGVVAQVNGQNITRAQMLSTLADLGGQPLLGQMVRATLVEQEAKRLGVTVTEAEIRKEIASAKQNLVSQLMMQGNPMSFSEYAAQEGISEGLLRYSIRQRLLARKTYRRSLEKSATAPPMTGMNRTSPCLIATVPLPQAPGTAAAPAAPPTDDAPTQTLEQLRADIVAGKTTFAAAAKQNSDDKGSGAQGGDLGWMPKGAGLDPAFEQAAFELKKPGDISAPIKSQYGWHIIRLDKNVATAADKAQLRNQQIAQQEQNPQGFNIWMAELQRKARITTNTQAMSTTSVKTTAKTTGSR